MRSASLRRNATLLNTGKEKENPRLPLNPEKTKQNKKKQGKRESSWMRGLIGRTERMWGDWEKVPGGGGGR